jgi:hypothetical protein
VTNIVMANLMTPIDQSTHKHWLPPQTTTATSLQCGISTYTPTGRNYTPSLAEEHQKPLGQLTICWQQFLWCLYCFITGQWSNISPKIYRSSEPITTITSSKYYPSSLVHEVQTKYPQFNDSPISTQHKFLTFYQQELTIRHAKEEETKQKAKEEETKQKRYAQVTDLYKNDKLTYDQWQEQLNKIDQS